MLSRLRLGLTPVGDQGWLGGVHYVDILAEALAALPVAIRPRLFAVAKVRRTGALALHRALPEHAERVLVVGRGAKRALPSFPEGARAVSRRRRLSRSLDFLYPLLGPPRTRVPSASWIPDFQHAHLPAFFDADEIARRDRNFARIAKRAPLVVVSSRNALEDFRRLHPTSRAAVRVLHFHARARESLYEPDPRDVAARYGLPARYLICCNQFWAHKDHGTLFRALARLHAEGPPIDLVCTGAPDDYRAPGHHDRLRALLAELRVDAQVHLLGRIPRDDQLQLLRGAVAVVQPSRFEGWGTVVEDARVLGVPMVLSDLPVHREQAPDPLAFFDVGDPASLAAGLAVASRLPAWPRPDAERFAHDESVRLAGTCGRVLALVALEAQVLAGRIPRRWWRRKSESTALFDGFHRAYASTRPPERLDPLLEDLAASLDPLALTARPEEAAVRAAAQDEPDLLAVVRVLESSR